MAENIPLTVDYQVIRLSGLSNRGGNPDNIANKIMANWRMDAESGNPSGLSKGAVPSEAFDPNSYSGHGRKEWRTAHRC